MAACKLQLKPEEVKTLRDIADRAEKDVKGDRYGAGFMEMLFVHTPEL